MNTIEALQTIGLTQHEARVYLALIQLKSAKAAAIVEAAGMYEAHVYKALRRLAERGIVTGSRGRHSVFSALKPESALADLLREQEERVRVGTELVKELGRQFQKPSGANHVAPFLSLLRTSPGKQEQWILDLAREYRRAKSEILMFAIANEAVPATDQRYAALADEAEMEALRKGVSVRCLVQESWVRTQADVDRESMVVRAGEQARVVKHLPMNAEVVDRSIVWFRPVDRREAGIAYRFSNKAMGELYGAAFDYYWSQGVDWAEFAARWSKKKPRR